MDFDVCVVLACVGDIFDYCQIFPFYFSLPKGIFPFYSYIILSKKNYCQPVLRLAQLVPMPNVFYIYHGTLFFRMILTMLCYPQAFAMCSVQAVPV